MKLAIVFEVPDDGDYARVAEEMILRRDFSEKQQIAHWSFDMAMTPVAAIQLPEIPAADLAHACVDQQHPWIPGGVFLRDPRLKPLLLAVLEQTIPPHG